MSPNVIPTGKYLIKNAGFKNLAYLPDSNYDSSLTANASIEIDGAQKWNITQLSNGHYNIQNYQNVSFASCGTRAEKGHRVVGRDNAKQWVLTETKIKNQYVISPSDSEVFWGLDNGEEHTPITLTQTPTDPRNQWTFESTP
ncbi:hypothetical protein BD410DRAFT_903034 [Rickenella mellea]|uniref:Ricin B lectin domain-containing protein n=1 Tax=Rickenella mellea TaxID=50990 RepID=A0A4Y7PGA0_9AGAM|nr:hypothetical protein BD410DRAFT_903034 [Rickenella mellea]